MARGQLPCQEMHIFVAGVFLSDLTEAVRQPCSEIRQQAACGREHSVWRITRAPLQRSLVSLCGGLTNPASCKTNKLLLRCVAVLQTIPDASWDSFQMVLVTDITASRGFQKTRQAGSNYYSPFLEMQPIRNIELTNMSPCFRFSWFFQLLSS